MPRLWDSQEWRRRRNAGPPSSGLFLHRKKPVHIHFLLGADINMPVHDHRYVESKRLACLVASGILIAVIEFVGDIRGIARMQDRCSVRRIPALGTDDPD